jgi:type II secretory pathway component PulF
LTLSNEELGRFFTELQGLVRAGVPLGQDLDLKASGDTRCVRQLWDRLQPALERGQRLSEALRGLSPEISESTLALLRAGEESGDLLGALEVVAQGHRRRLGLERCLRLAMIYPVIVILFMLGVMVFFGAMVIPEYRELGRGVPAFGRASQAPASWALLLCLWMAQPLGLAITGALALLFVWAAWSNVWLRPWVEQRFFAWVPILGRLMDLGAITRWAHTVGHLLERRVGLDTALALGEGGLGISRLTRESKSVREQVNQGVALSTALLNGQLVPRSAAGLLLNGEQRGDLHESLIRLSDHWSERLDYQVRKFEQWIEPAMILFAGLLVLWLALSLYIPIGSLMTGYMGNF